jgi:O-acetyl-ADP-ribose deacetylase (regulator of RNase III)
MKDEKDNKSGAKELLRKALFEPDDELELKESEDSAGERTSVLDTKHSSLLSEFASHLEKKVGEYKGDAAASIKSALGSVRSQIQSKALIPKKDSLAPKGGRHGYRAKSYWSNPSVKTLAGLESDENKPVDLITQKARELIFEYIQEGGSTDPLDPFDLARYKKLKVEPCEDVLDARTVHTGGRLVIQYNPKRPRVRTRFSICHEITHTMFPDCATRVRNRATHEQMEADEWQLESLCDIGAAELLMPIGSFTKLEKESLSLDTLLKLKDQLDVSTEAFLIRVAKLTKTPCFIFGASRYDYGQPRYKIDYAFRTRALSQPIPFGLRLPADSVVANCTRYGFTDKAHEDWYAPLGTLRVECVAVSPYPDSIHPRVMGIAIPVGEHEDTSIDSINYVKGSATEPRGRGHKIIAQVVNNKAAIWGAGFARAVRSKWPEVQKNFAAWALVEHGRLKLGNSHLSSIDDSTDVFHMISQRGYGPSPKPRIRYSALKMCLERLAQLAVERNASVHMPRIGCGQAGGNWDIVSELIMYTLCERGVRVTVYDLPGTEFIERQPTLF